jgi:hypothetical protein
MRMTGSIRPMRGIAIVASIGSDDDVHGTTGETMASIRRQAVIHADVDTVWDALRPAGIPATSSCAIRFLRSGEA